MEPTRKRKERKRKEWAREEGKGYGVKAGRKRGGGGRWKVGSYTSSSNLSMPPLLLVEKNKVKIT
jgi:hypothetical protein